MIENMNELNEFENFNLVYNDKTGYEPDENDRLTEKYSLYNLNGCTYQIPIRENPPCYLFDEIAITLGDKTITSTSSEDKVYLFKDKNKNYFDIQIKGLEPIPETEKQFIDLYLYKENTAVPILTQCEEPDDENDIYANLSCFQEKITPGNYFLLINHVKSSHDHTRVDHIAGHTRFSFTILESGTDLSHPEIISGNIRKRNHTQGGAGILAGDMNFHLVLSRKTERLHEYKIECYNESLLLMGGGSRYIQSQGRPSKELELTVHSEKMWVDGNYFAILSHNNEPFVRIDFLWEGSTCTISRCKKIHPGLCEYLLLKPSEDTSCEWEGIRELPGVTEIKWRLLERAHQNQLDRIRSRYNLAQWKCNTNFIITGPDNSTRNELAERMPCLYGKMRRAKSVQASTLIESKNVADPYEEVTSLLQECKYATVNLFGLDALQFGNGRVIIQKLRNAMTDEANGNFSLCLSGTQEEIARFFEGTPEMRKLFSEENRFDMQSPTLQEFIYILQDKLKDFDLYLSPDAQLELAGKLTPLQAEGALKEWDGKTIERFIGRHILPGVQRRLLTLLQEGKAENKVQLTTVFPNDIDYSMFRSKQDRFTQELQKLNNMVGLRSLKQELQKTFCRIRFNEYRKRLDLPIENDSCHHMIFTGNPGTGKTTVAQMIGRIYHAMGLLSKGELVMTERSQIVGRYIGETERNMSAILEQARGNVLFIDEAYTLCDTASDRKDFGYRAIECLLTVLSRKNPDMLVIMAGYDHEMEVMMEANQGLKGRFPHKFHFEDYSADELMQIARNWLAGKEYRLSDDADTYLHGFVSETIAAHDRHFSNARWMEQLLSHSILPIMAERILSNGFTNDRQFYQLITREDVEQACKSCQPKTVPQRMLQRRIGFIA